MVNTRLYCEIFETLVQILTYASILRGLVYAFWSLIENFKEDEKQRYSKGSKQKAFSLLCIQERGQHKGHYVMKLFCSLVSLLPSRYGCTEKERRAWYMYPIFWLLVISHLPSSLYPYKRLVSRKRFLSKFFLSFVLSCGIPFYRIFSCLRYILI
jgi:hypothetical protein